MINLSLVNLCVFLRLFGPTLVDAFLHFEYKIRKGPKLNCIWQDEFLFQKNSEQDLNFANIPFIQMIICIMVVMFDNFLLFILLSKRLKMKNNNISDSQISYLELFYLQLLNQLIVFYKMNLRKIISTNNQHKKLILTDNYQTRITKGSEKEDKIVIKQKNKQNIRSDEKDEQEQELCDTLPTLKKYRYSVPSLGQNLKFSRRKSSNIINPLKARRSVTTNLLSQRIKITQTMQNLTKQLLNCNLVKNHFNKYLVQPKDFTNILLYLFKSIYISRNVSQFLKNLKVKSKFTQLQTQIQKQEFDSRYSFKDSGHLRLNSHVISISWDDKEAFTSEKVKERQKNIALEKHLTQMSQQLKQFGIQSHKIRCLEHETSQRLEHMKKIQNKVASYEGIVQNLQVQIKQKTLIIQKLYEQQIHIFSLLQYLDQNKYRKMATQMKQQEQQMYDLVDYYNIHPLGVKNYERPKFAAKLEIMLQTERSEFQNFLSNCGNKQNQFLIKTFLNRIKNDYRCLVQDLVDAIAQKTSFIENTSTKIKKWKASRLKSKQMVSMLGKGVSLHVLGIEQMRTEDQKHDRQALRYKISKLGQFTDKLFGAFKVAQNLF